jgi:hypothetical protein
MAAAMRILSVKSSGLNKRIAIPEASELNLKRQHLNVVYISKSFELLVRDQGKNY